MLLLRVRQVFAWGLDGAATLSTHRGKPCCFRLKTPRRAGWGTRSQDSCRCRGGSICFSFNPFFLQGGKKKGSLLLQVHYIQNPSPFPLSPTDPRSIYLYLGKGLSRGSCRYSKERGSSRMQRLEKGRRNDRWMGNVEDSGRYLRWWSI